MQTFETGQSIYDAKGRMTVRKNSREFVIEVSISTALVKDKDGCQVLVTIADTSERAKQTREIEDLNRLYSVLSRVSQAVVRATSPAKFLEQACREVVEGGGFLLAWIGQVELTTNAVVPTAFWGEIGEYVRGLTVDADSRPEGLGPTGTCIREHYPVVHNDFLHDPQTLPWGDRAAPFGIASAAVFPIERAGRAWGALTIYSDEVDRFGGGDVRLLEEVAGDIEFALDNLDREFRRQQAEEALMESEKKFKSFAEQALAGIYILQDGVFKFVNAKFAQMFGYTVEECLSDMPFKNLVYSEDLATVEEQVRRRISGEAESVHYTFRGLKKNGQIFLVEVYGATSVYKGKPAGAGTILDITDRKQSEDELRVSLRFLEIVHEHTETAPLLREYVSEIKNYTGCDAVGIRVVDENSNIPYVAYQGFSRKFYEIENPVSLKTDECMCINVIRGDVDLNLPFFTAGGAFCVNATSRFLATFSEEEKGRTRNRCNAEGYETVGLFPFRSEGRILGLVHVADHRENMLPPNVLEVLEKAALQLGTAFQRAQAEEALRESQQMLQSVMDTIPARVFWKDLDLNYLGCNRPFALDAGLQSPEELIGRNDFEMCWGEQADLYRSDDRLVMETGIAKLGYEEPQTMPDGGRIWLRTSKVPLFDVKGQIKGVLGTYEDITVHKRAEEALQKAHDELELRVKERTAALEKANEELQQIPSKLIAVQEEERKRLASELHDSIGQTLAAVKFWVEMALKFKDAGDGNAALNHLEQFVPILQRSIEETRSIYMGLRPTMLDSKGLLATLEWLRQECMKLYPERHIELEAGIAEEAIPKNLKVNIFRIAQEALNNIAKHSKAEWVDISLSKDGNGIELVVSDDGVGMDLDIIMQTSTATSLGLTSMRERAELTGGSFSIESTPGEGTTIRASWPI